MPTFYQDVEAEVEIEIEEFVDALSSREKQELIDYLIDEGHICSINKISASRSNMTLQQQEFENALENLKQNRLRLSNEEEQLIINISNKF
jgi:ribosomal protein S8